MRSTIRFLAAAGLGLAAMAARADPGSGFPEAPFVGARWAEAPQGAIRTPVRAEPRLAVAGDAFVGIRWSDTPALEVASTPASPAAAPGPRSAACACR